jgi:hypothetical protein
LGVTDDNSNNADSGGALFLSYAGADREVAAEVAQGLCAAGVDVWWDQDGVGWGDDWLDTLQDKLRQCGGYIGCSPPKYRVFSLLTIG